MAALVVQDKYFGKRLDHADIKEVVGTDYAKGTIADFQVLSTDPLKVSSMVRVSGEWGESEFIPLFYSPRLGYWDTDHQSQDFNGDDKCFENAWMSFRCGDEVKVMLRDKVPVAVVGFADGVPRVGENLFYWSWPFQKSEDCGPTYVKVSDGTIYKKNEPNAFGPDGLKLKLVQEPIYIWDGGDKEQSNSYDFYEYFFPPDQGLTSPYYGFCGTCHSDEYSHWWYRDYFIIIGPILYILGVVNIKTDIVSTFGGCNLFESPLPDPVGGFTPIVSDTHSIIVRTQFCNAGLYTSQLLESLKGKGRTVQQYLDNDPFEYEGTNRQTKISELSDIICEGIYDDGSILVRPHTKAELQAVGMWPA